MSLRLVAGHETRFMVLLTINGTEQRAVGPYFEVKTAVRDAGAWANCRFFAGRVVTMEARVMMLDSRDNINEQIAGG